MSGARSVRFHELGDPGAGEVELARGVGLVPVFAAVDGGLKAVREGEHLGDPGRPSHGLRWRGLGLFGKRPAMSLAPPEETAGDDVSAGVLLRSRPLLFLPGCVDAHTLASTGGSRCSDPRCDPPMKHWDSYQTWKTHRNPARAELERQHGYDTKHAMHLIRLMRMGLEVLETGDLGVRRDAVGRPRRGDKL